MIHDNGNLSSMKISIIYFKFKVGFLSIKVIKLIHIIGKF